MERQLEKKEEQKVREKATGEVSITTDLVLSLTSVLSASSLRQIYKETNVVRRCVDHIANSIADLPREYNVRFGLKKKEVIDLIFVRETVTGETFRDVLTALTVDILVLNKGVLVPLKTVGGRLTGFTARDASTFHPVYEKDGRLRGYIQQTGLGKVYRFRPDELVYIQFVPKTYASEGVPILESLTYEIASLLKNLVKSDPDSRKPIGTFIFPEDLDEDVVNRFQEDLTSLVSGSKVKIPVVWGAGKGEWIELVKQFDIQMVSTFLDRLDWLVRSAFGFVPPGSSLLQSQPNEDLMYSTLVPTVARAIQNRLNRFLEPYGLTFKFKVPPAHSLQRIIEGTKSGLISPNEARQFMFLPPVRGGDQLSVMQPKGLTPVGSPSGQTPQQQESPVVPLSVHDHDEDLLRALSLEEVEQLKNLSLLPNEETARFVLKRMDLLKAMQADLKKMLLDYRESFEEKVMLRQEAPALPSYVPFLLSVEGVIDAYEKDAIDLGYERVRQFWGLDEFDKEVIDAGLTEHDERLRRETIRNWKDRLDTIHNEAKRGNWDQVKKDFDNFMRSVIAIAGFVTLFANLPLVLVSKLFEETQGVLLRWVGISDDVTCYDEETKVLTDKGWKFFRDLDGSEKMLSINPNDPSQVEWIKPVAYQAFEYDGEMIHFENNQTDLLVTPDHQCFVYRGEGVHKAFTLKHVFADELESRNGRIRFYRSSKFGGVRPSYIRIGSKKVDTKVYCEFMGYYLSEGSITFRKKTYNYLVTISQKEGEKKDKIRRCLEKLPWRYFKNGDNALTISSKELYEYLKPLGTRSWVKRCPLELKQLAPEFLNIFLDAFCLGDGWVVPAHTVTIEDSKFHCRTRRGFVTSSPFLCADISELLVKVGSRPSIAEVAPGKEFTIQGKIYETKRKIYRVTECLSVRTDILRVSRKKYRGKVYDVTLPKWHTLYVMRNGKCLWSGNCEDCAALQGRVFKPSMLELLQTWPGYGVRCGHNCRCVLEPVSNISQSAVNKWIGEKISLRNLHVPVKEAALAFSDVVERIDKRIVDALKKTPQLREPSYVALFNEIRLHKALTQPRYDAVRNILEIPASFSESQIRSAFVDATALNILLRQNFQYPSSPFVAELMSMMEKARKSLWDEYLEKLLPPELKEPWLEGDLEPFKGMSLKLFDLPTKAYFDPREFFTYMFRASIFSPHREDIIGMTAFRELLASNFWSPTSYANWINRVYRARTAPWRATQTPEKILSRVTFVDPSLHDKLAEILRTYPMLRVTSFWEGLEGIKLADVSRYDASYSLEGTYKDFVKSFTGSIATTGDTFQFLHELGHHVFERHFTARSSMRDAFAYVYRERILIPFYEQALPYLTEKEAQKFMGYMSEMLDASEKNTLGSFFLGSRDVFRDEVFKPIYPKLQTAMRNWALPIRLYSLQSIDESFAETFATYISNPSVLYFSDPELFLFTESLLQDLAIRPETLISKHPMWQRVFEALVRVGLTRDQVKRLTPQLLWAHIKEGVSMEELIALFEGAAKEEGEDIRKRIKEAVDKFLKAPEKKKMPSKEPKPKETPKKAETPAPKKTLVTLKDVRDYLEKTLKVKGEGLDLLMDKVVSAVTEGKMSLVDIYEKLTSFKTQKEALKWLTSLSKK